MNFGRGFLSAGWAKESLLQRDTISSLLIMTYMNLRTVLH